MKKTTSQSVGSSSRRQFLKTSGAAALGGALASPLAFAQQATAAYSSSDTLKLGLIGCGGRGTGAAAQALSTGEGVVLTALGDVFEDRLQSSRRTSRATSNSGHAPRSPTMRASWAWTRTRR